MIKQQVVGNFEFPVYKNDKERIKAMTKMYKDTSIADAFNDYYKLKLNLDNYDRRIELASTKVYNIGDTVELIIDSVATDHITYTCLGAKENIIIKQDLERWPSIKPNLNVTAKIIEKRKDGFLVDCIEPLYNTWLENITKTFKNQFQSAVVDIENLQSLRGGYIGKAKVNTISELSGKPYFVDVFIPGSYITLNREYDFSIWEGKNIKAMVVNLSVKNDKVTLVCSRKKLLNCAGGNSLISLYDNVYREGGKFDLVFNGNVTGIINSANKTGVFVEVPEYSITGLVEVRASELVKYKIGKEVNVVIDNIEYDKNKEPYKRNSSGIIYECNLKPLFCFV